MNLNPLSQNLEFATRSCTKAMYLEVLNKFSEIPGFTVNRQTADQISLRLPVMDGAGQYNQIWPITPFTSYTTTITGLCQYKEVALSIALTWIKSVTLFFPIIIYTYHHQNYKPVTKADIHRMTADPANYVNAGFYSDKERLCIQQGEMDRPAFITMLLGYVKEVRSETTVPIHLDDNVDVKTLLDKGLERYNDKLAKMKKRAGVLDPYQQYLDTRFNPLLKIYNGYSKAQKKIAIPG